MPDEEPDQTRELVIAGLNSWNIRYNLKQLEQLIRYRDLLVDWNANRMNLTRLVTPRDVAIEHFLDSLSLLDVLTVPRGARLLDIGAGAGFPSLVLKIMRPDLHVTLIEATAKKLTFCRAVIEELGLENADLLHARAEKAPLQFRRKFDFVTARAVASLDKLVIWCEPYLKLPDGVIVAYKGSRAQEELILAADALKTSNMYAHIFKVKVAGSDKSHELVICKFRPPNIKR